MMRTVELLDRLSNLHQIERLLFRAFDRILGQLPEEDHPKAVNVALTRVMEDLVVEEALAQPLEKLRIHILGRPDDGDVSLRKDAWKVVLADQGREQNPILVHEDVSWVHLLDIDRIELQLIERLNAAL